MSLQMSGAFAPVLDLDCLSYVVGAGNFKLRDFDMASTYPDPFQHAYFANGWLAKDPVVLTCAMQERAFDWSVETDPNNVVLAGAADFGMRHGASCSSLIAGNSCVISLTDNKPLSDLARQHLADRIKTMHMEHLATKALGLNPAMRETVKMFAHGMRAKQVAHEFDVSEEAIKLRKVRILKQIGITSFATAIHVCAVAGVTVH